MCCSAAKRIEDPSLRFFEVVKKILMSVAGACDRRKRLASKYFCRRSRMRFRCLVHKRVRRRSLRRMQQEVLKSDPECCERVRTGTHQQHDNARSVMQIQQHQDLQIANLYNDFIIITMREERYNIKIIIVNLFNQERSQKIIKKHQNHENSKMTKNRPKNTNFDPLAKNTKKRPKTPNLSNPRHLTSTTCSSYNSIKTPFISLQNRQKTPKKQPKMTKNDQNWQKSQKHEKCQFWGVPRGAPGGRKKSVTK